MSQSTVAPHGLHHVTAIASDPQRNVDFYTTVLGLRLVKTTVNFDDPSTYHLYYGDDAGRPATILTFFPWTGVSRGRQGSGLTTATAFSVPPESLSWWAEHLATLQVDVVAEPHDRRAGSRAEEALTLRDPDGLVIELVAAPGDTRSGWDGHIPAEHAVRGLHSATLTERVPEHTAALLTGLLNMDVDDPAGADRARFTMPGDEPGVSLDATASDAGQGLQAGGTVHHIAFRAPDRDTQDRWRHELVAAGLHVTPILDRQYFTSIYFREPGGVLFEIATDQPGFDIDEPLLELGRHLKLPPWLEPTREQIEHALPPLRVEDQIVEGTA